MGEINISLDFNGERYIQCTKPYLADYGNTTAYYAGGVTLEGKPIMIRWNITQLYRDLEQLLNSKTEISIEHEIIMLEWLQDETNTCDWSNPDEIITIGG